MQAQLFIFFADGELRSICEDAYSAKMEERYLMSRFNSIEVGSVVAESLDDAWKLADFVLGVKFAEALHCAGSC